MSEKEPVARSIRLAWRAVIVAYIIEGFSSVGALVINEIMPAPNDGGEWIELFNEAQTSVDIKDWRLTDASDNYSLLASRDRVIGPGSYLIMAEDSATAEKLDLDSTTIILVPADWSPLNNEGDHLWLADAGGLVADQIEYGSDAGRVAGRSWERIDAHSPGLEHDNWGPCADFNGHTAGRANSLIPLAGHIKATVSVSPNPFNPYRGEVTVISFSLPAAVSRLTVYIYDAAGRRVGKPAVNIPAGSRSPLLTWDGRDDNDDLLPIGRYIVYAEAVDERSGKVHSTRCTVVLADRLK